MEIATGITTVKIMGKDEVATGVTMIMIMVKDEVCYTLGTIPQDPNPNPNPNPTLP